MPHLQQMEQLKLQRLLQEFGKFLLGFMEKLTALAAEERPEDRQEKLENFLKQSVQVYLNHQQKLLHELSALQRESQALNIGNPPIGSFVEFMNMLQHVDLPVKKDFARLIDKFHSIKGFHERNLEQFYSYRDTTVAEHAAAVGTGIGRIKQLFTSQKKLQSTVDRLGTLQKKLSECENSSEVITSYQAAFDGELFKLLGRLEEEINTRKGRYCTEAANLIAQYNGLIESVKAVHAVSVQTLERYSFLPLLVSHLEHVHAIVQSTEGSQHEYVIGRFRNTLHTIIEQLRPMNYGGIVDRYKTVLRQLEVNGASTAVEGKLPYSLRSRIPSDFYGKDYTPHVPVMITLNTAYFRPYVLSFLLLGALYFGVWPNREWVMNQIDRLKPAANPTAVQETPVQPAESKPIGIATIVTYELNIRSGPNADATKVGTVKQGESYKVFKEQDGWLLVGDNEWISGKKEYVSFQPNP
jgi:hypothetical protein